MGFRQGDTSGVRHLFCPLKAQWEFEALTPEEQAAERKRAEESKKAWKKKIAELKEKRGEIVSDVSA